MMTRVGVFLSLVASVTALSQPPIIFSEPPYEVYYKYGESVQLPCVANGEPQPQYRWRRNNIEFNPSGNDARIVQLPNNGTLVINSSRDTDAGIYQCFASNSLGTSASKKIKLIQAKLGEFAYGPPTHYSPRIGEPFTLPCIPPESVPPPLVYWINEQESGDIDPYIYDSRVSMDTEFRLRFANVRAEDRKGGLPYACVATNHVMGRSSIGTRYYISPVGANDALAGVKYLWADQDDRFGLLGDTFTMKCIFSGNPTPDVHWQRLENKTLPDRARFTSFGQELEITNLQYEDAGSYECWGANSVSGYRVIRSFNVLVSARPYFLEEPKDIEISIGTNVEFSCIAGGQPEPDIDWFIDGVALRDVTDPRITGPRFKRPLETKIVLENVQWGDHMVVQCNASNIFGYVFANAYLNVVGSPRPDAPTEVVWEGSDLNGTISWKPGRNYAPVDYFVVEYNTSVSPDTWTFFLQVNSTVNRVNFTLSPWIEYTFRVIAYNEIGASKPSNPSPKVSSAKPDRPSYNPRDLRTLGNRYGKLYIEWTPVPEYDQNGPGFYYILKIIRIGEQTGNTTLEITINDWKVNHYEMSTGSVYTRYQIILTAWNSVGAAAGYPSAIIGYAYGSSSPRPDAPTEVVWEWCNVNATISWRPGGNYAPVDYFVVEYNTSFSPDTWTFGLQVNSTVNRVNFTLSPWVEYTFRVIAYNEIGASKPSNPTPKVCATKPNRPAYNPRDLRTLGNRYGKLYIEWTPVPEYDQNGPGFYYILRILRVGAQAETATQEIPINDWKVNHYQMSTGYVYTPYRITLRAGNSVGEAGEDPSAIIGYSYETYPSITPVNLTASEVGQSYVILQWDFDRVEIGKANTEIHGEFRGFQIDLWERNRQNETFRQYDIGPESQNNATANIFTARVDNLLPNTNIEGQIHVKNNYYISSPEGIVRFKTLAGCPN